MKNSRRAFTLIELLIAVLIFAALAAALAPGMIRDIAANKAADIKACETNKAGINAAVEAYMTYNPDDYPDRIRDYIVGHVCPITKEGYEDAIMTGPLGEADGCYLDFTIKHDHDNEQIDEAKILKGIQDVSENTDLLKTGNTNKKSSLGIGLLVMASLTIAFCLYLGYVLYKYYHKVRDIDNIRNDQEESTDTTKILLAFFAVTSIILIIAGIHCLLDEDTKDEAAAIETQHTNNADTPQFETLANGILKELARTTPEKTEIITAMDNSKVLVIPKESGGYIFYRDKDDDGIADTRGEGFYMMGLSRKFEEKDLPEDQKKTFKEIRNTDSNN